MLNFHSWKQDSASLLDVVLRAQSSFTTIKKGLTVLKNSDIKHPV